MHGLSHRSVSGLTVRPFNAPTVQTLLLSLLNPITYGEGGENGLDHRIIDSNSKTAQPHPNLVIFTFYLLDTFWHFRKID